MFRNHASKSLPRLALLAPLLIVGGALAGATPPEYCAGADAVNYAGLPPVICSSVGPIINEDVVGPSATYHIAQGEAMPGVVNAFVRSERICCNSSALPGTYANGKVEASDVVFSSASSGFANVYLNLVIKGDLQHIPGTTEMGIQTVSTDLLIWPYINGSYWQGTYGVDEGPAVPGGRQEAPWGSLSGLSGNSINTILTIGPKTVPLNTPVTISWFLQATARHPQYAYGMSQADMSMRLPTTIPVFTIVNNESGVLVTSVDSPDLGIVGNQFELPGSCDGDANGDGTVDVNDISFVIFRLGAMGTPGAVAGDEDGSGTVDVNDISYVIFRLGSCG